MSGAICLKLCVRPTHHYLYHYSYPRLSISAAATYLVDRHDAWPAEWQRGMYSIAVEVGTMLPVGFVSRKERLRPRTWLPSKPTDFQC